MSHHSPVTYYWQILLDDSTSGLPFPSPGDLSDSGIEPGSASMGPVRVPESPLTLCSRSQLPAGPKFMPYPLKLSFVKRQGPGLVNSVGQWRAGVDLLSE